MKSSCLHGTFLTPSKVQCIKFVEVSQTFWLRGIFSRNMKMIAPMFRTQCSALLIQELGRAGVDSLTVCTVRGISSETTAFLGWGRR